MAKQRINDYLDGDTLPGANLEEDFDNFTVNTHEIISPMDGDISAGTLYKFTNLAAGTGPGHSVRFEQLGWNLIQTINASASSFVTFSSGLNSTYNEYVITLTNIVPSNNNETLQAQISSSGVFQTSTNYAYVLMGGNTASTPSAGIAGADSGIGAMPISFNLSNVAASFSLCGELKFWAPSSSTAIKLFQWNTTYVASDSRLTMFTGGGYYGSANAIDGIRFFMSVGTIASGAFTLYGIRKT